MSNIKEYVHLAYLFMELCLEHDLLFVSNNDEINSASEGNSKINTNIIAKDLCEKVYAENAKLFYKLDNMSMFKSLCSKAGSLGEELLSN